jgi:hypothetical protein
MNEEKMERRERKKTYQASRAPDDFCFNLKEQIFKIWIGMLNRFFSSSLLPQLKKVVFTCHIWNMREVLV